MRKPKPFATSSNLHIKCGLAQCKTNAQDGIVVKHKSYCSADHARNDAALQWILGKLSATDRAEYKQTQFVSDAICSAINDTSDKFCQNNDQRSAISDMDAFLANSVFATLDRALSAPALLIQFHGMENPSARCSQLALTQCCE